MEPNWFNSFSENYDKPVFDPFWPPFDPLSQERKMVCTFNLAHVCRMIISSLSRRWNQIITLVFEKISNPPFLTHFLPHIWRTRFLLESKLYTHTKYHKSPILIDNWQNLMKSFQESRKSLFGVTIGPISGEPDFFWPPYFTHTSSTIKAPFWQIIGKI